MPGVLAMDTATQNGLRTDHDRPGKTNGVNGTSVDGLPKAENLKIRPDDRSGPGLANGGYDSDIDAEGPSAKASPAKKMEMERRFRMNDLPDEIIHITQGYYPLSDLITRLAQMTHNELQALILSMAKMPVPSMALNGNASSNGSAEDTSTENLNKKEALLAFAQFWHAKWAKALIITNWSQRAEEVSKLIDIKSHIDQIRMTYDSVLQDTINVKRGLTWSRLPNPDLKTALQVLSTGDCSWMPELNYIGPAPLTPEEQLKWIDDLNTLLAIRLNLDEFDKIPRSFKQYRIESGRVTFEVEGEFEVDLTIADEDFEKQFWFIDFRFAFSPAPSSLSVALRAFLEARVNEELSKDGLQGCYNFLHEFVMTYKINEIRRQALELNRSTWTNTLTVERLNRALAVQYWTNRYGPKAPKSWIMLAVNSGKSSASQADGPPTSHLVVRWYRDGKEIKDVDLAFDQVTLSAESLLKGAIARHVEHILSTIHSRLQPSPRFENREATLELTLSKSEPIESSLVVQMASDETVTLRIEPVTGMVSMEPHAQYTNLGEQRLNIGGKNPADEGVPSLEMMRKHYLHEQFNRRGRGLGWATVPNPLDTDNLKVMLKSREPPSTICLQRRGWDAKWYVMLALSLSGDEWWLFSVKQKHPVQLEHHTQISLNIGPPNMSEKFWNSLTVFATGMISHITDLSFFSERGVKYQEMAGGKMPRVPKELDIGSIMLRLSDILPSMRVAAPAAHRPYIDGGGLGVDPAAVFKPEVSQKHWARDYATVQYRGLQSLQSSKSDTEDPTKGGLSCVESASLRVVDRRKFTLLKGKVDRDVTYDGRRGEFCFLIRHRVGESMLPGLETRVKAVDRLVDFLGAIARTDGTAAAGSDTIQCRSVTLRRVVFTYGRGPESMAAAVLAESAGVAAETAAGEKLTATATTVTAAHRWRVVLDLARPQIEIGLERGNPHLRLLDLLNAMVNQPGNLRGLTRWLPCTLSLMLALDAVESRWEGLETEGHGRVLVMAHALDQYRLCYVLPAPTKAAQQTKAPVAARPERRLELSIRLRAKSGEVWWHVKRCAMPTAGRAEEGKAAEEQNSAGAAVPEDDFSAALGRVWAERGGAWRGLASSAAARPDGDIEKLVAALDDAVVTVATGKAVAETAKPAAGQGSAGGAGSQSKAPVVILD